MKELEFINSRVENCNSRTSGENDCASTSDNVDDATSRMTESPSPGSLNREEINFVVSILNNFNDKMTIYRSTLDDRADGGTFARDGDRDEIIKIRDDSLYVSNIFEYLTEQIERDGSYDVLVREIERYRKNRNFEMTVAGDYAEAKKRAIELRKLVIVEKKSNVHDEVGPKARLVEYKNENERLELTVGIESRYVRLREEARCEASSVRCEIRSKNLRDVLENVNIAEKNERRVATEIEAFLEQNATANERASSQWRDRYEREMRMYESENKRLKNDIENRRKLLEKLGVEYLERQEFIDKYLKEKDAAVDRQKRENHRRDCSTRIQAWWRGVMVRRKLGPYRPDERKKKRAGKPKK